MTQFTDRDRMCMARTLTLLEGHVKLSDERHADMKKLLADHEKRIRTGEVVRGWFLAFLGLGASGAGVTGGAEAAKEIIKTQLEK